MNYELNYLQKKELKKILKNTFIYGLLIIFGFNFISPLFNSFLLSFFSEADMSNATVYLFPAEPTLKNYFDLLENLDLLFLLLFTTVYAGGRALLQTISTAIVGYGLARYEFKGKKVVFILIVIVFLIPQTVVMIQNFILMGTLQIKDTLWAFYLPAIFAQGLNSSIFIIIYYSFFKRISNDLYESAELEGARPWDVFAKIILPLVKGAIIITFVLSFVWYWNDGTVAPQYYRNIPTINESVELQVNTIETQSDEQFEQIPLYDGVKAAAIMISTVPLLIFYLVFQEQFRNSTIGSGLTGQ